MTGIPASACSRSTALMTSTASGSSPAKGSSRTSSSGAKNERGGELDALLVAEAERLELVVAPLGEAEALQPARGRRARVRAGHAVQLTEVAQLVGQAHLRVQATLLGHVADLPATVERQRHPAESHLARVGGQHASMMRIVVVLPAPLRPTNPKSSPADTSRERSSTATTSP